jgi:hypothetical protein
LKQTSTQTRAGAVQARHFRPTIAVSLLLALLSAGCAANKTPRVTFHSEQNGKQYSQPFTQSVFSRNKSGQVQVVLIDQGAREPSPARGGPLQPTTIPPLKEIMTIRLLWQPAYAAKARDPTAANAAIDWYVIGENSTGVPDQLHYQGAGFARVSGSGDRASVDLQFGKLALVSQSGELQDPLGPVKVFGSFQARRDEVLADATLQDLRQRIDSPPGQTASQRQGPPPRSPPAP